MSTRVKSVAHLNIQFTDKARTKDFYEKVFGSVTHDEGQLQARMEGVEIHFSQTANPIHAPLVHFAMEIDDWDGMMATLAELDVEHGKPPRVGPSRDRQGATRQRRSAARAA